MGFSSMSNFDDFNGIDNFDGSVSEQIIIEEETVTICVSQSIDIVQQRLSVMTEIVKEYAPLTQFIVSLLICRLQNYP